ncbi:putative ABC transport system permease protein [Glaciihabitans tibetensis]|uniref:Putative ABC transport system permease protein n=1 Tax=Glaciihabitans tibetensis TaxID=1266600 RepID=A0A2T0VI35_9MICO|nr:ABC transporter permease [Glaciihabitans tibetensis]PRY69713.1 putative ABC transport system permease protein [Glaciihabitans tibetensis]
MSVWSSLVGSVVEAAQELRIHRTRVLLSLIGVAVAVCAISSVVGLGAIAEQAMREQNEKNGGRAATLYASAYSSDGAVLDMVDVSAAFDAAATRYSIDYTSRNAYAQQSVQYADGTSVVDTTLVDIDYGTMHRVDVTEGSWFTDLDTRRLAPALVINSTVYQRLGSPDLSTHPTLQLNADTDVVGVIVGVTHRAYEEGYESMYILADAYTAVASPEALSQVSPNYELWVPEDASAELVPLLQRDIASALGEGVQVDVNRQDYGAYGEQDFFGPIRLLVGGVAALVLLLGALGLVNISLVTVRQRVREIGIRRSFGATAGRVFFAVMMESVVATLVAGVFGVAAAVAIVQNPTVQGWIGQGGITDTPAFPLDAAVLGLLAATAVGALAGLLPALVAVRVRVIDAIRF